VHSLSIRTGATWGVYNETGFELPIREVLGKKLPISTMTALAGGGPSYSI